MKAPTNTNTTATSFDMGCSLFTSTGKTRWRHAEFHPVIRLSHFRSKLRDNYRTFLLASDCQTPPSLKLSSLKSQGLRIGIGRHYWSKMKDRTRRSLRNPIRCSV